MSFSLPHFPATCLLSWTSTVCICLCLLTVSIPQTLHAQYAPTESKGMDISAFAGYTYLSPDFGPTHNQGISAGVNITRYFRLPIAPSLELRATDASGSTVTERTVLAGLRAQSDFHAFHPYIDFLAGVGSIVYAVDPIPGYHEDRGFADSIGGGVDIDLIRHFQAKIDFQHQSWNMGKNSVLVPQGGNYTLSPNAITIGIAYRIPFRPHLSAR